MSDDAWDEQWQEWNDLDDVATARFGSAILVSRALIAMAAVIGFLGLAGSVLLGVDSTAAGLSSRSAAVLAIASGGSVLVVSALLAAAGYGLRALVATWAETWETRVTSSSGRRAPARRTAEPR